MCRTSNADTGIAVVFAMANVRAAGCYRPIDIGRSPSIQVFKPSVRFSSGMAAVQMSKGTG
jgi:hypothetical protein